MNRAARSLILCGILILTLLTQALAAGTLVESDAPVAEDISVNAYSAILLDMDSGQVLYEYNADERNYPASTTKLMTALLCLEHGNMDDVITVSASAINAVPATASKGDIYIGEVMTVHQVMQLMLVVSASEATTIIAEYIAGDIETFVDMMNQRAQELGCTGTHYVNTHGFPNSDHYTTARDLTKIAMADMEYQEFRDIVGAAVTTVEPTNYHGTQVITSTNGILPGSAYPDYNYPYAIGIKTGHTNDAGYCLVSAADKDGLRLMCVVMGTPSRTSSFAQSINLYEWGYENYDIIFYGKTPVPDPELPDMADAEEDPEVAAVDERQTVLELAPSQEPEEPEAPAAVSAQEAAPAPESTPESTPGSTPEIAAAPAPGPEARTAPEEPQTASQTAIVSFFHLLETPGSGPILLAICLGAVVLLILLGVGIGLLIRKKDS